MPAVPDENALYKLVNSFQYRTYSPNPRKPSDITNLMFVGTQAQIENAFKEA